MPNRKRERTGEMRSAKRPKTGRVDYGRFAAGNDIGQATRFTRGQSGNPSGRPHKSAFDYAIEEFLSSEVVTGGGKNGKRERKAAALVLAEALFQQALAGKRGIAQLLAERSGGRPMQAIQFDGKLETAPLSPEQRDARIRELIAKGGYLSSRGGGNT